MKTTPRWLIAVLRESALEQPLLPWQRRDLTADHAAAPAAMLFRADAAQLRKIA